MMNIQAKYPTTPNEFLRWNEGREGKREFVNGKVVEMMVNVTENHYRLAARLLIQIASQLSEDDFVVGSADFGVSTARGVRYPDVMVHQPGDGLRLATSTPLLIAEILSASSMADDFGPKAEDYLTLQSLEHYLVLSQDKACVWLWSRTEDRAWGKPDLIEAPVESLTLAGLDIALDLNRLYAGIVNLQ